MRTSAGGISDTDFANRAFFKSLLPKIAVTDAVRENRRLKAELFRYVVAQRTCGHDTAIVLFNEGFISRGNEYGFLHIPFSTTDRSYYFDKVGKNEIIYFK